MFGIGTWLPGWLSWLLSPRVFTAKHSHLTNGDSATSSGWSWESSLREQTIRTRRTETGNQVGSFMLKSRSFELICSRTSHH